MNIFWGILICFIGLFFSICGFTKSEFVVYKVLTARSRILWKENVHTFYAVIGIIIVVFGILVAAGVI